jgi:hypothetical protein
MKCNLVPWTFFIFTSVVSRDCVPILGFIKSSCTAPCRKDLYTSLGSWKCPSSSMACILTSHVTHWACLGCSGNVYDSVFQFPPISRDNIPQATIKSNQIKCIYIALTSADISKCYTETQPITQNSKQCRCRSTQQPDQLYAKEMCHTAWGKW